MLFDFADPASGSTSAGLTSEIKAAETPEVKQVIAKEKKHPGSLDDGKWMLIHYTLGLSKLMQ